MTVEHKITQSGGQYIINVSLSLPNYSPPITTYTYQVTWLGVGRGDSTSTAKNQEEIFILKKEFLCTMTQLLLCHFAVVNLAWIMHLRDEVY